MSTKGRDRPDRWSPVRRALEERYGDGEWYDLWEVKAELAKLVAPGQAKRTGKNVLAAPKNPVKKPFVNERLQGANLVAYRTLDQAVKGSWERSGDRIRKKKVE